MCHKYFHTCTSSSQRECSAPNPHTAALGVVVAAGSGWELLLLRCFLHGQSINIALIPANVQNHGRLYLILIAAAVYIR
jgi:hypothetical protein